MNKWFCAVVLLCIFPVTAMARAEIQIFMNYRGPGHYDYKVISSTDNPVSAWYILPPTANAACFKGDPYETLSLVQSMVAIYNAEYERDIQSSGYPNYDTTTDQSFLVINQIDENGRQWTWFPRLRECERWSTVKERAP